jgi:hypothetical protein
LKFCLVILKVVYDSGIGCFQGHRTSHAPSFLLNIATRFYRRSLKFLDSGSVFRLKTGQGYPS